MEYSVKNISNLLFEKFVINHSAAAIQQPDGRYITKYFPFNAFAIESMLKARGAIGCYQQSYYTGLVKWICFDFDCKDKENPNLLKLHKEYITKFVYILDKYNITYLTEFSGRRGIHVWLLFNEVIPKSLAYGIVSKIFSSFQERYDDAFLNEFNVDLFPATESAKGNKVGKQVKIPLSYHTQGGQSFFFEESIDFNCVHELGFFDSQFRILEKHIPNDVDEVCSKLLVHKELIYENAQRYKKFKLVDDIICSVEDIENILSETKIFSSIFERIKSGSVIERDWFVILGTLGPIDLNGVILHAVFSKSPAYNQELSSRMIEQWRNSYSPATFRHLYSIYGLEIEQILDGSMTGLEYLLKRLYCENAIELDHIEIERWRSNELEILNNIKCTVDKECKYIIYNDENVDISIWNKLNNVKGYDLLKLEEKVSRIKTLDKVDMSDIELILYERIESEEKTRLLVSLGAFSRIITTHLALQLAYKLNRKIDSFSYNIVFISKKDIFYNWYSSWKNYMGQIRMFMEIPFLSEWGVMTIDIKNFYNCIDFLSVYNMFQNLLEDDEKNIFRYLINFNDEIMRKISDKRIGVPQGPAYARIISEMFLSTIIETVIELDDKENCRIYRYVDDIVIFYTNEIDGNTLFNKIRSTLKENGLEVNSKKSRNYGVISELTPENREKILKSNAFNYNLQISENNMLLTDIEKSVMFKDVIDDEFNINDVGYVFGKKTDDFYSKGYFKKFMKKIFAETNGRGSIFASFYRFIFINRSYFEDAMNHDCFSLIDINSINFKNCISQIYLALQNKNISVDDISVIEENFFRNIDLDLISDDERTTIKSIIQWRQNNEDCS